MEISECERLRYGEGSVSLCVRGAKSLCDLKENAIDPIADVDAAFLHALEDGAIASKPLRECVFFDDQVTIVISDVTRMWMHQDVITRMLVEYLHEKIGVPFDNIVVLVALGTHRPQTDEEMRKTASDYVFERVRCINHDGLRGPLAEIGRTKRATPVLVNPLAVGRKVITVGGTVFHLLAGFGGGRKSILPGISGWETIQKNHSLALDPKMPRSNPKVGSGKLLGNPVHEDMMEAAAMVGVAYSINLVVNSAGKYVGIFGGDLEKAWLASCACAQRTFCVPIDQQYDVVIASGGGYPKDINLYQGSKTLINAVGAVKPGGTIIYLAKCPEGGGPPAFFDWIEPLSQGRLDAALRENFTIAGYIFYTICEIARHAHVRMLTDLSAHEAGEMGIFAAADVELLLRDFDFTGKSVAVMQNGANVVPRLSVPGET